MRSGDELFFDLVNLNADEWNKRLSDELGVDLDLLKTTLSLRESVTNPEERYSLSIKKSKLNNVFDNKIDANDTSVIINNKLSKYVLRLCENNKNIESIACTGKCVVGIDFRNCDLSSSYFCDCIFFNCDFSESILKSSVFNGCIINECNFYNVNINSSFIIKTKIMDSVFNKVDFGESNMYECMFIGIQAFDSTYKNSSFYGCGFFQCFMNNSDFCNVKKVMNSVVLSEFMDSNFSNSYLCDTILMNSDFSGADFINSKFTCVSVSCLKSDENFKNLFSDIGYIKSQADHEFDYQQYDDNLDEFYA